VSKLQREEANDGRMHTAWRGPYRQGTALEPSLRRIGIICDIWSGS
jgi:hypothetical protein